MERKLSFCAIDFETMTAKKTSACAVGIVKVVDNVIQQQFYSLIDPIPDDCVKDNSFVHGITWDMVKNAPMWSKLWPLIEGFFDSGVIVGHNLDFDLEVLWRLNDYYNLPKPAITKEVDTMRINNGSLVKLCEECDVSIESHHNALCDAMACAECLLAYYGIKIKKHHYEKSEYSGISRPSDASLRTVSSETKKPLDADDVENKETPFFQKKVVITGTFFKFPVREELAQLLKKYGADINGSISGKTNIVVMGEGAGPSKMAKIAKYQSEGKDIQVFDECKLLEIIKEFNLE